MTTITHSAGEIVPVVVDGFESSREARTLVHTILGRPDPDVTFRPTGLRTGTLSLVFASGLAAAAAESVLATSQVFTLSDVDVPQVDMSFVVPEGQDISVTLDDETRSVWVVQVPFQEVLV